MNRARSLRRPRVVSSTAPRVHGRPALSRDGWRELKLALRARSGGRCEVVLEGARCIRRALDPNHIVKCSQGGADSLDNVIAVCRRCHDATDLPFARGKLVITPLGDQRFDCRVVTSEDKWTIRGLAIS